MDSAPRVSLQRRAINALTSLVHQTTPVPRIEDSTLKSVRDLRKQAEIEVRIRRRGEDETSDDEPRAKSAER